MAEHWQRASYRCRRQERANLRWGAGAKAAWRSQRFRSTAHCLIVRRRIGRQSGLPVAAIDSPKLWRRPFPRAHDTKHNWRRREIRRGLLLPASRPDSTRDAERVHWRCILPSWQSERREEWLWRKPRLASPYPLSRHGRLTPTAVAQSRKVGEHAQEIADRQAGPVLPVSAD